MAEPVIYLDELQDDTPVIDVGSLKPDTSTAKVEKPKRSLVGEFGAGLAQGALQLPQMVGGATKLAGDAIGSETVSALGKDAINYWGNKLKPYEAEVPSFTDVEDAGDAAKYVAHGVGALVPTVAASVVSGGIGAGLAKEGVKRAIAKEIVKRELKHEAVDLMAKGAVKETVKKAVTRGAIAGAGAASYGMEAGSIYTDQTEQGIEKPFKAALTAVPAAALDVIPELRILSKIPAFKVLQEIPFFKTAEGRNALVRGGKEALKQGGAEGVTEFAQTLIERYGADKEAFSKEGLLEAANAGILGGIGGGMMGGVAGSVQKPATDTNLLKEDSKETSDIAQEILRVRNQPLPEQAPPVAQPEAYDGPVMDAEAPTPEDLELQSMQRENENYRQQQLMDKQDIPTVEEKPVPQVPSSFKTVDGKVTVKTKAVGEGVFQVETTNIDEYGHKKTFVQEMNAEDAVKHIDNVTPPVTRDQYLQVKGANNEAMSEMQTSNAEGDQSLSEVQNKGSVNDSPETGGVVRPVGEGAQPGGAVSDTATSALPTGEGGGMLPEGSTVETASSKESKASDETSKTAPKVVIKSLSDLPTGQHEIKGAGTFLVDDKGKVKILRGTKLESVDPMRRKLAIDKYNGMVLAEKQKANLEALKVGKTKQKAMAEEARGIAEDDAPFLRAALQNVKDADFGKISVDGNQAEATWSTFGALIPYIRGTGFNKADAVKIMAEAVNTGKLPPEKNKAERSLVESALKHEKERIEEAENRVETEDERLVQQELAEERDTVEGGDTSFEFGEEPESSVLMEGDQPKLFPTPPTFGKKPQGTGTVSETPMLTEMKEREAESKQTSMTLDMLGMQQIYESLTDGAIKAHAATALDKVHRMLENPGGLGSMERGKEYLQLKYLLSGTFDRLQEVQRNLYQDFRKASKETKEKIFEFMEDAQADPLTIPVEYRQKAINAKTMIMEVGAKLVARKMLPAEIYEENKGRYLPRVYLKHILGEDGRAMVMNGSGIKAYLGYLKKRLEMTPEQRLALGQIKDPGYLISRAFGVPMRDMEIFDFFDEMITNDEGEAAWVLPESATPWTVDGGKAIQQVGNVTYTKNDDGTYNLTIKKVSHVQTKNKAIPASDLNLLLGSDKLADYIKAGKGKQVMRKDGDVYKPTPWKRVGHIQYRLNPDGTYNVNLTNKVASETKVDNVKNLEDHISEYKAERITEGKGKVVNGRMVTPYWLSAEADRILTKQIPNMAEPDRSKAIEIAKRMQDTAAKMMEGLNKTPEEVAKHFQAMPDSPKYGALRGLWVRREIYNDLVGNMKITVGERSWPEFLLDYMMNKGTSLWKWVHVAANPPTQVVNFISNGFLLHISGVPMAMVPYRITQAISEMLVGSPNWQKLKTKIGPVAAARVEKFAKGGKHWKIAKEGGVKSAGMANVELYRVEQDMLDLIALDKPWWHPKVMLKIGGKIMNATGDVYQMWESIGKTAKIIHEKETPRWREKDGSVKPYAFARDKGSSTYRKATDNEAIVAAHDALFDYSLAPGWVKFIRKFPLGTPFVTFTYKVLPATIKAAALTPWVFTPYLAIHYGLPYAIMAMTGIDDKDDYDKLMQTIFKFVREKSHVYLWPVKDAKGRWQAFDLGRYIPWAQWMAFQDHVRKREIVTAFADDLGVGSGPAMDLVDLAKNQDSFTKQPIYDVNADFNEQAGQVMMYLTQMATPPWLTNRGWAGKLYSAMNNEIGKPGEQKPTVAQANLRLIGANFYQFDPEMSRAQNINQMDYAIAEVRQQKNSALKDRDLTDADRKEVTLKYDTIIQKMNLKKMKYAANSMPKDQSLLQR